MPPVKSDTLVVFGRILFTAGLGYWGWQQLWLGDFVTRAMPPWPDAIPLRHFGPYLIGSLFFLAAAAVLLRRCARRAALIVATVVLLGAVFLALPNAFNDVRLGGAWTLAGKAFVIGTGALAIAATFPVDPASPTDRIFLVAARVALADFLIQSGIQHFVWAGFVHTLVPAWIPGGPFWTYFSGVALILGGIGLLLPATAHLAALFSGAMIFAWVFTVHLPRAFVTVRDTNEATALFEAIAFSGLAFVLAGKSRPPLTRRSAASPQPLTS